MNIKTYIYNLFSFNLQRMGLLTLQNMTDRVDSVMKCHGTVGSICGINFKDDK